MIVSYSANGTLAGRAHTVPFVLVRSGCGAVVLPVDGVVLRAHIAIQLKAQDKSDYILRTLRSCLCASVLAISGEEKMN